MAVPFQSHAIDVTELTIELLESDSLSVQGINTEVEFISLNEFELTLTTAAITHNEFGDFTDIEIFCRGIIHDYHSFTCNKGTFKARHKEQGSITGTVNFLYGPEKQLKGAMNIVVSELPVQSLIPMIKSRTSQLEGYELTSGILNITADIEFTGDGPEKIQSSIKLGKLSIEGENVLENVAMDIQLGVKRLENVWQFSSYLNIQEGVMYVIPGFQVLGDTPGFYIDADANDLEITAKGQGDTSLQQLTLNEFNYHHHDLLQIRGNAQFDLDKISEPESLELDINAEKLATIAPVYIEPLLLATNFGELELAGAVQLGLTYNSNELSRLSLVLNDVYLDDEHERFSVSALNSNISIGKSSPNKNSKLEWRSLSLYKIIFGSGDITMRTGDKKLEVIDWRDVDVLDGTLLINQLSLSDIGQKDFKLTLHGELTPISLMTFTQTLGWPLLSGRLSGAIDGLEYSHGDLKMNGDLEFRVFDGDIVLNGLVVENLFDRNSRFYTDVEIINLDLKQLTETFSFGKIEGSLDGYFRDLTLIDWQPVYFDAVLRTPDNDKRPHRISQKALDNLSEIGGGMPGVLSQGFMRFIPEYSYGRLGIRCLLSNRVCNLGGVEETEDGFYIMTRGGVLPPWVDVKGTGRSIIWKHLVDGLKQIAEGEIVFE